MTAESEARRSLQEVARVIMIELKGHTKKQLEGDVANQAFLKLRTCSEHHRSLFNELVKDAFDDPRDVLLFIADYAAVKTKYKRQSESIVLRLFQEPAFRTVVDEDTLGLATKLRALGREIEEFLGPPLDISGTNGASAAASADTHECPRSPGFPDGGENSTGCSGYPSASSKQEGVDASRNDVSVGGCIEHAATQRMEKETGPVAKAFLSQQNFTHDVNNYIPEPSQSDSPWNVQVEGAVAGAVPVFPANPCGSMSPRAPWAPGAPGAPGAPDKIETSASETQQMLRESIKAMSACNFQFSDTGAGLDFGLRLFDRLELAVNRANFEYQRHIRPVGDPEDDVSTNSSAEKQKSFRSDDFLAGWLDGLEWDPTQVLTFLYRLYHSKRIYRKRIENTAKSLNRMSGTYREIVLSTEILRSWLGNNRCQTDVATVVEYGFASTLRWASWEAAAHWADVRRGRRSNHLESWEKRKAELMGTCELPTDIVHKFVQGTWLAAEFCSLQRWPETPQGWGAWIMTPITGKTEDDGLKVEFNALLDDKVILHVLHPYLCGNLKWMIWSIVWHVVNQAKGYGKDAKEALVRAERHFQGAIRGKSQWRGVNLGGWFLLEKGPCTDFWESLPPEAKATNCEWACCEALGSEAAKRLNHHRRTYYTRQDFLDMKAAGLTHVRLPFGAWCVAGPRKGEPYVGPCLDALRQALNDLEFVGMRVLLDLHGTVGGENDEPPCGRANKNWKHTQWNPEQTLEILRKVAEEFADRTCICGIGVANEPAESIPVEKLANYYESAIDVVRQAGMCAGRVSVVLPIFTERRIEEFLKIWVQNYRKYDDCVFDVHMYQCFGLWQALPLEGIAGHMQAARGRLSDLRRLPACCVSEWSLALPKRVLKGERTIDRGILKRFGESQLESYEAATHGWFFWTWKDSAGTAWNMRECVAEGVLKVPQGDRNASLEDP